MTLWLLGGHDPTHGAGLYRDLVTARALAPQLVRRFAVTACTEQGHGRPARSWPVSAERLLRRTERWPAPRAIKIGLVPDPLAAMVATLVKATGAPVVVDPVLVASDGGELGATPNGLAPLLEVAALITPNRPEARALIGRHASVVPELGRRFANQAVLLKDGHSSDPMRVTDRLVRGSEVVALSRARQDGPDPRGTGCALATAVAVGLARGETMVDAVRFAVSWLDTQRSRCTMGVDGRAHLPG